MAGPYAGRGHVWRTALTGTATKNAVDGEELLSVREEGGKAYLWVKAKATMADGRLALWHDITAAEVSTAVASGLNMAAGFGVGAITTDDHGWIQIGGYHANIHVSGNDSAKGMLLFPHSSSAGKCAHRTIGQHIKLRAAALVIASVGASRASGVIKLRDVA